MKTILRCKICGKIISGCATCEGKIFNWKNVACCPEHFAEYVKKVEDERRRQT